MSRHVQRADLVRVTATVVALLLGVAATAAAQTDDIKNTKHNFSALSGRNASFTDLSTNVADYGEICVYCHTPHGGQTGAPLWNRAFGSGPYQMYTSATIEMTIGSSPGPVSLACLSCHDGTIGIDVITNPPNSSSAVSLNKTLADIYPTGPDNLKVLGVDLRNDHPIAVTYDVTQDAMFNPQATVEAAGLRFFGAARNEVQCATCHNPHNKTNVPFLRRSNSGSGLCLTCHIK